MSYRKGDPDCMTSEQAMKNIEIRYKTNKPKIILVKDNRIITWDCVDYDKPEGFDGW